MPFLGSALVSSKCWVRGSIYYARSAEMSLFLSFDNYKKCEPALPCSIIEQLFCHYLTCFTHHLYLILYLPSLSSLAPSEPNPASKFIWLTSPASLCAEPSQRLSTLLQISLYLRHHKPSSFHTTAMLTSHLCHAQITPSPWLLLSILSKTVSPICVQSPLGQLDSLQKCPVGTTLTFTESRGPQPDTSTHQQTQIQGATNIHLSLPLCPISQLQHHTNSSWFSQHHRAGRSCMENTQTSAAGLLAQGRLWVHAEAGSHPHSLDSINELSFSVLFNLLSLSSSEVLPPLLNQRVSLGTLLNATVKGHRSMQSMFVHPTIAGVFSATMNLPPIAPGLMDVCRGGFLNGREEG